MFWKSRSATIWVGSRSKIWYKKDENTNDRAHPEQIVTAICGLPFDFLRPLRLILPQVVQVSLRSRRVDPKSAEQPEIPLCIGPGRAIYARSWKIARHSQSSVRSLLVDDVRATHPSPFVRGRSWVWVSSVGAAGWRRGCATATRQLEQGDCCHHED